MKGILQLVKQSCVLQSRLKCLELILEKSVFRLLVVMKGSLYCPSCPRFEEAENDCSEALNLDDSYVKAYSRRITARKGLGKLKEAMDDAEFAVSIDANNRELRKQYSEIKALLMEDGVEDLGKELGNHLPYHGRL